MRHPPFPAIACPLLGLSELCGGLCSPGACACQGSNVLKNELYLGLVLSNPRGKEPGKGKGEMGGDLEFLELLAAHTGKKKCPPLVAEQPAMETPCHKPHKHLCLQAYTYKCPCLQQWPRIKGRPHNSFIILIIHLMGMPKKPLCAFHWSVSSSPAFPVTSVKTLWICPLHLQRKCKAKS